MNFKYLTIILILTLSILVACSNRKKEPAYITMSDRIVDQYLKDMKVQYSLYCTGNGGGFMDSVNEIYLALDFIGSINQEELRKLLVDVTEELLKRFNENEEIRPYLKNYPFTVENIRIGIYLVDQNGRRIHNLGNSKELLGTIYQSKGIVRYLIENDEKIASQVVHRETYEEALKIVRGNES